MLEYLNYYLIVSDGFVIDKNVSNIPINKLLNTTNDWRIIYNSNNPNTLNYPTLNEYLNRELLSGRSFANVGVNFVETSGVF